MDDLESRLATLLRGAVAEPPHDLDVDALVTARPPRRSRRIVAPIAAAAAIAGIAIGLAVAASPNHRAPASRTTAQWRTWRSAEVVVSYPARWQALSYHGALVPTTYPLVDIVNEPVRGTHTFDGPHRIPDTAVDIRITYVTRPGLSLKTQPGELISVAGQPAKLYHGSCDGSGRSVQAAILAGSLSESEPPLLLVNACMGPHTTTADRADVRHVIQKIALSGASKVGTIEGRLVEVGGPAPGPRAPSEERSQCPAPWTKWAPFRRSTSTCRSPEDSRSVRWLPAATPLPAPRRTAIRVPSRPSAWRRAVPRTSP